MPRTLIQRFARYVGLLTLLATPTLLVFAVLAQRSNSNNVRDWLPKRFEATQRLQWYVERFGTDEVLVVSWPGCQLDDTRLDQLAELLQQAQPDSHGNPRVLFRDVFSGRSVLRQLTAEPLSLPREEALNRMNGWILGADGTTCAVAVVSLAPNGTYDRHAAIKAAEQAMTSLDIPADDWRIAGPTADAVAIDRAGNERIEQLGMTAAIWGALLAWLCLRDVVKTLTVFFVAVLSWATSLTMVYLSGQNMDAVLMTMPALIFVLAISGAIHLTHYFQHAARDCTPNLAVVSAIRNGWVPCVLACVTTAVGLASLAISAVTPVVRFGTFSAIGTISAVIILLAVWPSLTQLGIRWHRPERIASGRPWWRPIQRVTTRGWRPIMVVSALVLPVLGLGVSRLETSVKLSSLLPKSSRLMQSYAWLQASIGPIVPMEIVLQFPQSNDDGRTMLDRARLIESIRAQIAAMPSTGGTIAATTFAPDLPAESGARQVALRRIVANKLAQNRQFFEDLHLIKVYDGTELWRVSTRVETGGSVDYGLVLDHLKQVVANTLRTYDADLNGAEHQAAGNRAFDVTGNANADVGHADSVAAATTQHVVYRICGGVPLIYMAQQQLMNDLRKSFVTAFALIAIVMAMLLRSVFGGVIAMIPNLVPTLIVFGIMGLYRTPIDIGTMMTASVALGIAVDDTLHFLVWFRRGYETHGNRPDAVRFAFRHCATAMLHTTLICGLGMIPFVFSSFQPIARFAGVLCALLFAALLGDLLILPSLLISPFGKFVVPREGAFRAVPLVESPA